jgi:hypothetical protein
MLPALAGALMPALGVDVGDVLLDGVSSAPHAESIEASNITLRDVRYLDMSGA